jgi:hypothetical protein
MFLLLAIDAGFVNQQGRLFSRISFGKTLINREAKPVIPVSHQSNRYRLRPRELHEFWMQPQLELLSISLVWLMKGIVR